jgi:hypothetical protein
VDHADAAGQAARLDWKTAAFGMNGAVRTPEITNAIYEANWR